MTPRLLLYQRVSEHGPLLAAICSEANRYARRRFSLIAYRTVDPGPHPLVKVTVSGKRFGRRAGATERRKRTARGGRELGRHGK